MFNSSSSSSSTSAPSNFFPKLLRSETCESSSVATMSNHGEDTPLTNMNIGLRPSFGFSLASPPPRHATSPAGFIAQFSSSTDKRVGSSSKSMGETGCSSSRLSFNGSESLSQVSDHENEQFKLHHTNKYHHSNVDPILFSIAQRPDHSNDSHEIQFSMSPGSIGMASNSNSLLNIPQDSVPCKIRAKRGCATHPRSIAERERRTRISGKLKKLQDLVPNMDKQTSYADMLDLAVQHIKTLQTQVQILNDDLEGCSCGSSRKRNQIQQLLYKHY